MKPYDPAIRYLYQQFLRAGILNLPQVFMSDISGHIESISGPMGQWDLHHELVTMQEPINIYANAGNSLRGMYVATWTVKGTVERSQAFYADFIKGYVDTYWRAMK